MTNQPKKATARRKPAASKNDDPPVYLLSMEVEDILCFKERQTLKLSNKDGHPAQWTVILGNNGVGKTTLLRCLAGMEVSLKMSIPESNIFFPMLYTPSLFRSLEMWQDLQEVIMYKGGKINTKIAIGEMNTPIQNLEVQEAKISINDGTTPFSKGSQGLICYGYGATRRTGYGSFDDSYHHDHSESLFSDNASLMNAEAWLLETDYAVKSTSGKIHSRLQSEFKHIVEILKRILPDVQDIRIAPVNEDYPRPRAEFLTPFGWVRLSSLGLGYRTMIAWMVDLAVRLFIRYPDSEDPLAEPAIVLVDEIDLHMHPQWQRTIMEFLTERFPNTQFIVTAHSPLVVQAAQDANIVLLRREGDRVVIDNNPEIIENWRVDQVLTSVFEMPSARPAKIEPLLSRRQEILTKSKLTQADKKELKELEEKIGSLPTAETSEDIKAMDIIRRAAKLLEKSSAEAVE